MAELATKDEKVSAASCRATRRWPISGASARTTRPRSSPAFRAEQEVSLYREGALRGPVPRPARAEHGQAEVLQADEGRRRLLARRPPQRDAAAHLRHGLGDQGRTAAVPAHARRGREARPPQARPRARPVPHRRSGAGRGVLASQGLGDLAGGRAVHAPGLSRHRLPGSQGPADPRQEPVGEDRPLAELPREHVHDGVGEARVRAEADELPRPRADLQVAICAATATCRCATASSASAIATSPAARLHGIMRVRGFTQDDGHIFCTEDQILEECVAYTAQLQKVYADFGFTDIIYKVATRPENRVGSDEFWDKAEFARDGGAAPLGRATSSISPGDGAFYGPKIEYTLKDAHRPPVAVRHDAGRLQHCRAPRRRVRDRDERPRLSR